MPYARAEIWRLAKWLHAQKFPTAEKAEIEWAVADKFGWYDWALKVHNEVYRNMSPYLRHETPIEDKMEAARVLNAQQCKD